MTAEHLSISSHTACPTGLQSAVCAPPPIPMSQTQTTQGFTVNTALDLSKEGEREKVSLLADRDSSYALCHGWPSWARRLPFYELSRASRTFMICCLMTLVASPALGIKYLWGGNKKLTNNYQQCCYKIRLYTLLCSHLMLSLYNYYINICHLDDSCRAG